MLDKQRDIDEIIVKVKRDLPACDVQQLEAVHPADDDGIWYFSLPHVKPEIQLESSFGVCPFIVETVEQSSYDARKANTVDEAVSMIVGYLRSIRLNDTD